MKFNYTTMEKELLKSHKMFYSSFKLRCKGVKNRGEEAFLREQSSRLHCLRAVSLGKHD
jgi:hypothetical protein